MLNGVVPAEDNWTGDRQLGVAMLETVYDDPNVLACKISVICIQVVSWVFGKKSLTFTTFWYYSDRKMIRAHRSRWSSYMLGWDTIAEQWISTGSTECSHLLSILLLLTVCFLFFVFCFFIQLKFKWLLNKEEKEENWIEIKSVTDQSLMPNGYCWHCSYHFPIFQFFLVEERRMKRRRKG